MSGQIQFNFMVLSVFFFFFFNVKIFIFLKISRGGKQKHKMSETAMESSQLLPVSGSKSVHRQKRMLCSLEEDLQYLLHNMK